MRSVFSIEKRSCTYSLAVFFRRDVRMNSVITLQPCSRILRAEFGITRNMLHSHKKILKLNPVKVEEICLSVSQEFYDNATSGNYHFGDMKLAYEW